MASNCNKDDMIDNPTFWLIKLVKLSITCVWVCFMVSSFTKTNEFRIIVVINIYNTKITKKDNNQENTLLSLVAEVG